MKFMKQMRKFPSVIRTEYAYALLYEKDASKAERIEAQFAKCAKHHPYPSDIESERELLQIVREAQIQQDAGRAKRLFSAAN
jgi:hypothetical protein